MLTVTMIPLCGGPEGCVDVPFFYTVSTATSTAGLSYLALLARAAISLKYQVKNGDLSDCDALATFADDAAEGSTNKDLLKNAFGLLVPSQTSTRNIPGIAYGAGGWTGFKSNQSGYLSTYQNSPGDNSDQSHHFAAFFELGYVYGSKNGNVSSHLFEWAEAALGGAPINQGDVTLGTAAAQLGAEVSSGRIRPGEVGTWIREHLCQK